VRALLRAEWLRQRRRPDVWILPIAALALVALGWYWGLTGAERNLLDVPPDFPQPSPEAIAEARAPFAFPATFHGMVGSAFLAFIAAVHFGASWTGSEFMRGTIRNIFLAYPTRVGFFAARLLALAGLLAIIVVGMVALSFLLPTLAGVTPAGQGSVPSAIGLLGYAAVIWFSLWFLALVATVVAVLLRNGAAAVLIVLIYALLELFVVNAGFWRDVGQLAWLPQLLPGGRLLHAVVDVAAATGFAPEPQPGDPNVGPIIVPPLVGAAILAGWLAALLAALVLRVRSMDIGE
jgi:hypothetical protein